MSKAKQMTKKEVIDLMATFSLISISKMGNEVIEKYSTTEQIEKMMRVAVNLFDNDEAKAEKFIVNHFQKLMNKLDAHDDSECQFVNFKGDEV